MNKFKNLLKNIVLPIKKPDFSKKFAFAFLGITLLSFGVASTHFADFGNDAATVFCDGIRNIMHLPKSQLGIAINIFNFAGLFIVFLFADRYISIFTIVNVLFFGIILDFATWVYHMSFPYTQTFRIIIAVSGFFLVCYGIAILIVADIGQDSVTGLQLLIKDITHKSYRIVKTALDIILLILGVFLGGLAGPVTLIEACLMGTVVQKFVARLRKNAVG
jgi:uncharacterized membrane protein YczE